MKTIDSKAFSGMAYSPGKEIWIGPEDGDLPFYFDVSGDLTDSSEAMSLVAHFLDDFSNLEAKALSYLKTTLAHNESKDYETVHYFLQYHVEEIEPEILQLMLRRNEENSISIAELIDHLRVRRFGSHIDQEMNQQVFIMDLSLNPEYSEELMVIYFDTNKEIILITHES